MCSLGIEPTTFALLAQCSNHWATGTQYITSSTLLFTPINCLLQVLPQHFNWIKVQTLTWPLQNIKATFTQRCSQKRKRFVLVFFLSFTYTRQYFQNDLRLHICKNCQKHCITCPRPVVCLPFKSTRTTHVYIPNMYYTRAWRHRFQRLPYWVFTFTCIHLADDNDDSL